MSEDRTDESRLAEALDALASAIASADNAKDVAAVCKIIIDAVQWKIERKDRSQTAAPVLSKVEREVEERRKANGSV